MIIELRDPRLEAKTKVFAANASRINIGNPSYQTEGKIKHLELTNSSLNNLLDKGPI